ncbi:hypothetical protein N657DRAFT_582198 [Parathielavia appendiculata]|uniref:Uncharacterized protein n=1 Tax=Parathielavia appendiculata TaxID=2587402 RepID=A0AAN6TRM1_9PEZI|nr:hypothetical protein N657DRAFT_582198 [Parathielavia appendiculata]
MLGINLRSPPSRPPPPYDPLVEAWLDSLPLPAARPSLKELRQWRLTNYHGLGRSVFVTCLILRGISLAVALSVTAIIAGVAAGRPGPLYARDRLVPVLVVCPVITLWTSAELVAAWLLRDGGIPTNIHLLVDGVIFLGVATATGMLLVDLICGLVDYPSTFGSASDEIASVCLMVVLMVIQSFLLFFFICNYVDGARKRSRAVAGGLRTPPYANITAPRPDIRESAAAAGPPLAFPERLKLGKITTTITLEEFDPEPSQRRPASGSSLHHKSPAAALECSTLALAMSGLWDERPFHQASPLQRHGEADSAKADQIPQSGHLLGASGMDQGWTPQRHYRTATGRTRVGDEEARQAGDVDGTSGPQRPLSNTQLDGLRYLGGEGSRRFR